jgi:hypothetical protein
MKKRIHVDVDRRNIMKKTGGLLLAASVGSSLALSAARAHAAASAQKALQMLKEGNTRFFQGKMLKRDLMQQVKATARRRPVPFCGLCKLY